MSQPQDYRAKIVALAIGLIVAASSLTGFAAASPASSLPAAVRVVNRDFRVGLVMAYALGERTVYLRVAHVGYQETGTIGRGYRVWPFTVSRGHALTGSHVDMPQSWHPGRAWHRYTLRANGTIR